MTSSTYARNMQVDRLTALADGGWLRLYAGPRPESPDAAIPRGAVLLSEHRFASPAFDGAFRGQATSFALTDDPDARATDDASWFRVTSEDGATVLWDGTVGPRGSLPRPDIETESTRIQKGARVSIESITINQP